MFKVEKSNIFFSWLVFMFDNGDMMLMKCYVLGVEKVNWIFICVFKFFFYGLFGNLVICWDGD